MPIDFLATDPDERAAVLSLLGSRLPLRQRDLLGDAPPAAAAVWIHGDPPAAGPAALQALRAYVEQGGRLLLSGPAARLCGEIAGEPELPAVRRAVWPRNADPGEVLGVMGLPRQPLFHRLPGGVGLTRAAADLPRVEADWRSPSWPAAGRVLGVARRGDGCDPDRAVLVEHEVGRGRVLTLGVALRFAPRDLEMDEIRARFVGDLFDYLASDHAAERTPAWPRPAPQGSVRIRHVGGGDAPMVALPAEAVAAADPQREGFDAAALGGDPAFELVARDGQAVAGGLRTGIAEVWARSFRAFHELRLEVAPVDGGPLRPLADGLDGAWRHPREVGWNWRAGESSLAVRLAAAADGDGFTLSFRAAGPAALRVGFQAAADLRPSPPYPPRLSGAIVVGTARGGASTTFAEPLVGGRCAIVCDRKPKRAWIVDASLDAGGAATARFGREFVVRPGDDAVVSFGGRLPAIEEEGAVVRAPAALPGPDALAEIQTGVAATDAALARAAQRAADRAVPIDGRNGGRTAGLPGPAGFVAREAFELDRALLPLGARSAARADLALAMRFQDANGRIHGAVSPLGVARIEAADATPLFVDGVAQYLGWTGDLDFVRELWPGVRRALAWLERGPAATDPRADGSEAALIARAWAAGAEIARALDEGAEAARCAGRAQPGARAAAEAVALPATVAQALLAATEELLGLRLHDGHPALEPSLPETLDRVEFRGLRIGAAVLSGELRREPSGRDLVVALQVEEAPLALDLAPFVPGPARFEAVRRGADEVEAQVERLADGLRIRVRLALEPGAVELRFALVPDLLLGVGTGALAAGPEASAPRLLGRTVTEDEAAVRLDFECGTVAEVPLRLPGRPVVAVEGGELLDGGVLRISPPAGGGRSVAVTLRFGSSGS
jgi:hypothetical protein